MIDDDMDMVFLADEADAVGAAEYRHSVEHRRPDHDSMRDSYARYVATLRPNHEAALERAAHTYNAERVIKVLGERSVMAGYLMSGAQTARAYAIQAGIRASQATDAGQSREAHRDVLASQDKVRSIATQATNLYTTTCNEVHEVHQSTLENNNPAVANAAEYGRATIDLVSRCLSSIESNVRDIDEIAAYGAS